VKQDEARQSIFAAYLVELSRVARLAILSLAVAPCRPDGMNRLLQFHTPRASIPRDQRYYTVVTCILYVRSLNHKYTVRAQARPGPLFLGFFPAGASGGGARLFCDCGRDEVATAAFGAEAGPGRNDVFHCPW